MSAEKPATAYKLARAIARGCQAAGWDAEPLFRETEGGGNVEEPEGDETEVYFVVTIGPEPVRMFTVTVKDETLSAQIEALGLDL